jgi:hypothetical protein
MIVRVRAEARIEVLDAQAWHEERRVGLGAEFADAVAMGT